VWERQAEAIKNTDLNSNYLEAMRAEHDPSLHLKTIEGELMGTIGKALGRQGEKILRAVQLMNREYEIYTSSSSIECMSTRQQAAKRYNQYRLEALQARWELTVHRQAAGFIVNNHKYVTEKYPIAPKLPETNNNAPAPAMKEQELEETNKESKKRFTDQLDWWQRIGRWR
jgi:ribosome-binding ATPase YchF (GTP1/OBG family)